MWANLHLLFWLSLIPVLTEWIGEQHGQSAPAATYGLVCLAAAPAFTALVKSIIHADGSGSLVAAAIGRNVKPPGLAGVLRGRGRAGIRQPGDLLRPVRRGAPSRRYERPSDCRLRCTMGYRVGGFVSSLPAIGRAHRALGLASAKRLTGRVSASRAVVSG
jgi:hypothetical protein